MRTIHYEHKPTESLWIKKHNKHGGIRLFCLIGSKRGNQWIIPKERFAVEFKKLRKNEVEKFFEKE